jgi:MFS family permease
MANFYTAQSESIPGLIRGILDDLRTLIREEIALARVEMREQAGRARAAAVSFAMGAAALTFGGVFALIAVAMGIADLMNWPAWAGFLLVAVVLAAGGMLAVSSGKKQLREFRAVPEATVNSVKENSAWIAKRMSSDRR